MKICIIAAVGRDLAIGRGNDLIWRLPGDLAFFKRVTMGKPVIMGRRTFESLGRALPGRLNIVLSRNDKASFPGALRAASPEEALELCGDAPEVFVIGGSHAYREFLPLADELWLTEADAACPDAHAYFPPFDPDAYDREVLGTGEGEIPFEWVRYTRK